MKQLVNKSNGNVLATKVIEAHSFWKRFRGLMFSKTFPRDSALHIRPCRSIHTFFMNYAIDVLYLDVNDKIIAIENEVPPNKIGKKYSKASSVIELPAKKVVETKTKIGQFIKKN